MTDRQRLVLSFFDEDQTRNLAEIGRLTGCSKQAVGLTLAKYRPGWKAKHEKAKVAALKVRKSSAPSGSKSCEVCGKSLPERARARTCGGKCAVDWNALRWHLDAKFRFEQRRRIARWNVANPDKVNEAALRWSRKVLREKGPKAPPSRWVVAGGTSSRYADLVLGDRSASRSTQIPLARYSSAIAAK